MTNSLYSQIPEPYRRDVRRLVETALAEDIGSGDITTRWTSLPDQEVSAKIFAKENGVIAGLALARIVFKLLDSGVVFLPSFKDGQPVKSGAEIAVIHGSARALMGGERVALNFMQRMSGIASQTARLSALIAHTPCKILDTRKTIPGMRTLDKWSVTLGGGTNHRFGLYDMVLIKENHISMAGGLKQAVESVLRHRSAGIKIEVEVQSLNELAQALEYPLDRILLDNMSLANIREACKRTAGKIPLEASGNVTASSIVDLAETGVDYISIGGLTHSVRALYLSLLIETTTN